MPDRASPSPGLRCWAEVDLAALERNLRRIRGALPAHLRYVAVVKADAYGHGLPAVASRLMLAGADAFAVANVQEGADVRELGSGWPVLVLGPILPDETDAVAECGLVASVSSAGEADRLAEAGRRAGRTLPVHLKVDTGMGRSGVWHPEAAALAARIAAHAPHLRLDGVFTHFSSADSDPSFTAQQRRLFLEALARLPAAQAAGAGGGLLVHADNSAGVESLGEGGPFNAVRIGLLQYGVRPHPGSLFAGLAVEPVFSFHARVALVKALPAGTSIGYNRTRVLGRDSRTAVLSAGYGDGIPTTLSNLGSVLIRGHRCPILGRVSMDQTVVDVTDLPGGEPAPGEVATLIGRQGADEIDVVTFSREARSIPWEVFCSITKRVPRVYRSPA